MSEILRMHSDEASEQDREILGLALSIGHDAYYDEDEDIDIDERAGWNFRTGDPEIFTYQDRLVVPDGKVLDLGMGSARTSLFFAMHGMEVTGYDLNPWDMAFVNHLGSAYNLPIHGKEADITEVDLGENVYDTVILSQTLVHFPSTEEACKVLEKAARALKPGGNLYLRAVGKRDSHFTTVGDEDRYAMPSDDDTNVFYEMCDCSGRPRIEAHLFFDEIKLMAHLEGQGMQIWHSQVAPQEGGVNVMYGEDWHVPTEPGTTRAMITLIAQKKPATL